MIRFPPKPPLSLLLSLSSPLIPMRSPLKMHLHKKKGGGATNCTSTTSEKLVWSPDDTNNRSLTHHAPSQGNKESV